MFGKRQGAGKAERDLPTPETLYDGTHTLIRRYDQVIDVTFKSVTVHEREADAVMHDVMEVCDGVACDRMIVGLGRVSLLTSPGIGTLIRLHKWAASKGGRLAVYGLNDELQEVMRLTRMDRLFPIEDDQVSAYNDVVEGEG